MLYRIKLREFDVVVNEVVIEVDAPTSDEAIDLAIEGDGRVVSTKEIDRETENVEPLDCYSVGNE